LLNSSRLASGHLAGQEDPPEQIMLMAGEETFIFRYREGHEVALISCLMDYAADPRYPLGWLDVLSVLRQLGL